MNRISRVSMLTAALLCGAWSVLAQQCPSQGGGVSAGGGDRGPGGPGMDRPAMPPGGGHDLREQLKRAGATDAQIQAMVDLDRAQQIKRIDLHAKVEKAELELHYQMQSTNMDEKAAMDAVDTLTAAHAEMMKQEIVSQIKGKQILGSDVMNKFQNSMSQQPHDRRPQPPSGQGPNNPRPPRNGGQTPGGSDNNWNPPPPPPDENQPSGAGQ